MLANSRAGLKESALTYFREKAERYNERYAVKADGDLLWVRHRAILEVIENWRLDMDSRLVDLGCGPGVLTRDLARIGYCGVGVDSSKPMIEHCEAQAKTHGCSSWSYEVGDVEALPFPDRSFDAAICAGVIDYLPTDDRLLSGAARVLKPGGRMILCVTNKFGYTTSLSALSYLIKKVPGAPSLASRIRATLVGGRQGAMDFSFLPRKHRPGIARSSMKRHGFTIESDKYVHFSLLPAPFCAMTSKLNLGIDEKLSTLAKTPLRIFGSCYILSARLRR